MNSTTKWLIFGVIMGLFIIAVLGAIFVLQPEILDEISAKFFNNAEVNLGATSNVKENSSLSFSGQSVPNPSKSNSGVGAVVSLSAPSVDNSIYYSGLASMLSETPMVQDIPKGETILLRFYNFNTGYREFEESFILTKGAVKPGYTEDVEITIVMHSKYLPELSKDNLCSTITKANENGDVGIYTDLSTTKIIMKFNSMMEYKDCLM